jgi:hypothetical protein
VNVITALCVSGLAIGLISITGRRPLLVRSACGLMRIQAVMNGIAREFPLMCRRVAESHGADYALLAVSVFVVSPSSEANSTADLPGSTVRIGGLPQEQI